MGGSAAALILGNPALAQQAKDGPTDVDEIVVTATRQAVGLSKVPVSVAAFNQEQLDRQSARSFEDVARFTPGVTFSRATRGNTAASSVSIRGISSGAGAATVGVYIDETPVQVRPQSLSSSNPYPRVFDLERVEILRGPQGTLFGAGSEGGTIRFITPDPSLTRYSVYGRSELASTRSGDSSYEAGVAVGGPIVDDKLGFRISAWHRKDGGYVDRVDWNDDRVLDKNANWQDATVLRGALKWQVNEALTLTPSVYYQRSHINDASLYWEAFSNPGDHRFRNGNPIATPTSDSFVLPALKAELDLGPVTIYSNTSYFDRSNRNTFDSTTLGLANFVGWPNVRPPAALRHVWSSGALTDDQQVFTQEVRVQNNDADARLNWVLGAFYQHAKQSSTYFIERPFILDEIKYRTGLPLSVEQFFGVPLYQGRYQLYSVADTVDKELSAYANLDFKLTEKLKLTAGVRVSRNEYHNEGFSAGPTVSSSGTLTVSDKKDTPVSPKFGASYQADRNNLFYATIAKGYRQGSTTGRVTNRCDADLAALGLTSDPRDIAPDTVWSYEIGSKNRLFDGRLTIDASAYRVDWKNIQSSLILPNCNIPIVANLGDARSQGFDLQATARPVDGLTLGLSVGYADAKYTTSTVGAGGKIIRSAGEPLPISPWTIALSAQYETTIHDQDVYFRGDYQYASHDDAPLDLASAATDPTIPRAPESNNLDLRAGIKLDKVDISLFATNVLDQHPEYGRYRDTTRSFNYRGVTVRPRTVGVTAIYRY